MTQYVFDVGVTLNVSSIPEFANLNTQQLPMDEIRILVNTSIARTVILPYSGLFPVRNVKITVVDYTGNASVNNITVQASTGSPNDLIAGNSSVVIDTNYQAIRYEILNANSWSVVNGGGGGGDAVIILGAGAFSSVRCGQGNNATSEGSTVSGGLCNTASCYASTVSGGYCNTASCYASTVSGGYQNIASGGGSTIAGGCNNSASGYLPVIGGGGNNTVSSSYAVIGGGMQNCIEISSPRSTISGGYLNTVSGYNGTIGGGVSNVAGANGIATVGGGCGNTASGYGAVVSGGRGNTASGIYSSILGGCANIASDLNATVSGGFCNTASGSCSTVGGGRLNTASGSRSTVSGGYLNTASCYSSTVGGGNNNCASGCFSIVGGGGFNTTSGIYTTVGGGSSNTASGISSIIAGGFFNTASGYMSAVGGGYCNTASAYFSTVKGGSRACAYLYGQDSMASGQFVSIGDAQKSELIARKTAVLLTNGNTVLSLDGTGITNLALPAGSNRAWSVMVQWAAVIVETTGTVNGLSVGSLATRVDYFHYQIIGGVASISTVTSIVAKNDTNMGTADLIYSIGGSNEVAMSFNAANFTGGGTTKYNVVARLTLTEVAW